MKLFFKYSCFIFLIINSILSFSQNLVPNCSFESYSICPTAVSQATRALGWTKASTGTTDYYNSCSSSTNVSVPNSMFGFQNPRTGDGYLGFFAAGYIGTTFNNYYEYAQIQLSSSLIIGKTYYVEFYVSLADSSAAAAVNLGAYFSNTLIAQSSNVVLPYVPDVVNNSGSITTKTNWQKVNGCYTATNNAQYIIIGGFLPHSTATFVTVAPNSSAKSCYYYLDDVSVIPMDENFNISSTSYSLCANETATINTTALPVNYTFCDGTSTSVSNTFNWLPNIGSLSSYSVANPVVASHTNNITYTLQISNPLCGIFTNTITIFTNTICACPSPITPNISSYNATCSSSTGTIEITSVTNGSPNYTILEGGSTVANNVTVPHTITNVSVGTHTYVISSANSCSAIFTVSILPATGSPTISATLSNTLSCTTNSAIITATSTSSGVTYSWSPQGVTTNSIIVNSAGNYSLTVTNTLTGCSSSTVITVNQNANAPTISTTLSNTLSCTTNSAVITATSTTSGVTYSWSPQGVTTNSIIVNSAGNYSLIVTNTVTGCISTTVITVNQNTSAPTISVTLSNTLSCATNSAIITATSTTSGVTYSWSPQGVTTNTVLVNSSGNYTVVVTNTITGCISSSVITINQNTNAPTISVTLSNTLSCTTISAVITATSTTSGVTYSWIPQGITTNTVLVNSAGNYTVVVTNTITGCITSSVITINQNTSAPTISATLSNTLSCATNSAIITATSTTSGVTYSWIPQGITTNTVLVNSAGNYTVTVTDTQGCVTTTVVIVPVIQTSITLAISPNQVLTLGNQSQLNVSGATNYTWSPALGLSCSYCNNPIATPSVTTNYCVFANLGSCITQSCITITIEEACNTNNGFTTPNVFTPNGDAVNDEFCLQGWKHCVSNFNISIFNRWGEKVFESTDENFCWDGTYKNKALSAGVFVFLINAVLNNNEPLTKKGNITLIK